MPTDGSTSDQELRPRRRVGQFELFTEIASGGMATVHLGRVIGAGDFARVVAIKRLHAHFAKDPVFTRMFLDEARVVARIRHPNVTPTIDLIEEEGELFIVMEYVEGETFAVLLREARRRKERVPVGVGVRIMTGALHGLHAAHEATSERGEPLNLVHRDVSPENIMVGTDGYPRLLDFGIARALGSFSQTREGEVKGKLAYMTPEQILGEPVTRRTDVFAASVVLWQALTGRQLFKGKHVGEYTHKILYKAVDPPSYVLPDLPKKYDAIVLKGLAREPDERWPTALAMAEALEAVGGLATQREVGVWVRRLAAAPLAGLARKVSAVENAPHGATPMSIPPDGGGPVADAAADLEAARALVSGAAAARKPRSYRRVRTSAPPPSEDEGTPSVPATAQAEPSPPATPDPPATMPAGTAAPRSAAIPPPPPQHRGKAGVAKPPPETTAKSLGIPPPPFAPLPPPPPPNYSATPPGSTAPSLPPPSRPPSLPPAPQRPSVPPESRRPSVPPRAPLPAGVPATAAPGPARSVPPPRPGQRSAMERLAFPDRPGSEGALPPRPGQAAPAPAQERAEPTAKKVPSVPRAAARPTPEAGERTSPTPAAGSAVRAEPEPDDDEKWDGDEDDAEPEAGAAAPVTAPADEGREAADADAAVAVEGSRTDDSAQPPGDAAAGGPTTDGTVGRRLAWGSADSAAEAPAERDDGASQRPNTRHAKRTRALMAGGAAALAVVVLIVWGVGGAGGASADATADAGTAAPDEVTAEPSPSATPSASAVADAAVPAEGPSDGGDAADAATTADTSDASTPDSGAAAAPPPSTTASPKTTGTRGKRPPSIYGRR